MYHPQSGHMSRPPSSHQLRPTHVPLSLRTGNPTQNASQLSSPPNNSTPKPISSEKFPKALKLYTKYCLEKGLAQQAAPQSAIETTNTLNIPLPAKARSLTSRGTSRANTPSVSNSAYDGVTDISSVVSFGDESPGELLNFNGEVVKTRIRRPLSPVTKAKAALIRHLESCRVCRARRVACDLEHHDIASLEEARKARARQRARAQSIQQQARSTISNDSHASRSVAQPAVDGTMAQPNTDFLGIGQRDELLHTPEPAPADAQSPAMPDLLSDIASYRDNPAANSIANNLFTDPYVDYQNGQMIALGVLRGFFYYCTHLDGLCQQAFEDPEALQSHFETHFAYNRINPAYRYMCSSCNNMNSYIMGPCYNCGSEGTIETWIYGSYIRMQTFQQFKPDGQDFFRNDSAPYFPSMDYGMGNLSMNFGHGNGMDNNNYTTGGMNQGNFFYQSDNNFGDGSQGDEAGYQTPRSGAFFQGNWARNGAKASLLTASGFLPAIPGT